MFQTFCSEVRGTGGVQRGLGGGGRKGQGSVLGGFECWRVRARLKDVFQY